jgi:hypothetical protein
MIKPTHLMSKKKGRKKVLFWLPDLFCSLWPKAYRQRIRRRLRKYLRYKMYTLTYNIQLNLAHGLFIEYEFASS